jgi:ribonuclease P/MRP protein subunit POP5
VCRVVRVSGTIRKAEEEAILRAKRAVLALKEDGGSEDLLGSLLGPGGGGGEGAGIEDSDEDAEGAGSSDEDE